MKTIILGTIIAFGLLWLGEFNKLFAQAEKTSPDPQSNPSKEAARKIHQADLKLIVSSSDDLKKDRFVGDGLTLNARVKNVSDHAVLLPNWELDNFKDEMYWQWQLRVSGAPGISDVALESNIFTESYSGPIPKDLFRELPAQQTTMEMSHTFKIMVPGSARFSIAYVNEIDTYEFNVGKKIGENAYIPAYEPREMPGAWTGNVLEKLTIKVSDQMSAEMKARFDKATETLKNANSPLKDRRAVLKQIAEEKHYFAARFVAEIWKQSPDPALQAAALNHLLDLLEFGTAYRSLSDLIEILKDENVSVEARGKLLDLLGKMHLHGKTAGFSVAEQMDYVIPAEQRAKIMEAIGSVAKGSDPFLAVKAKALLEKPKK